MDLDTAVTHMTRGLRDMMRPTICIGCVALWYIPQLGNEESARKLTNALRRDHGEFLTTIMRFVTAVRTEQGMLLLQHSLRHAWRRCTLAHHTKALAQLPGDGIVDQTTCLLASVIGACLARSTRLLETQRFSRHWPCSVGKILPHGPRQTVTSCLFYMLRAQQYSTTPLPAWFTQFFTIILSTCPPELVPELLLQDNRRTFVDSICGQLDSAAEAIRLQPGNDMPLGCFRAIARLCQTMSCTSTMGTFAWKHCIQGSEERIMRSIDRARRACVEPTGSETATMLAEIQGVTVFNVDVPLPPELLPLGDVGIVDRYQQLWNALSHISRLPVCAVPDCARHQHELVGTKLRQCGGCKLFKYCLRDCQKLHWKQQPKPHKETCLMLQKLFVFAPFVLDKVQFSAACRAEAVTLEVCSDLITHLGWASQSIPT